MKLVTRTLAAGISLVYFVTNCGWAYQHETSQLARLPLPTPSFVSVLPSAPIISSPSALISLPATLGSIRHIEKPLRPVSNRVVIQIQDIHQNQEAQLNIGKAIDHFLAEKKMGMVGLEGAFDTIDLARFRAFSRHDIIVSAADYLLSQNRISGPVHWALTTTRSLPPLVGIDQKSHYEANVAAVRESASVRTHAKERLQAEQENLELRKVAVFSAPLRAFDNKVQAYRAGQLSLGSFTQLLSQRGIQLSLTCETFLEAWKMESHLDFAAVEADRSALLQKLVARLTSAQADDLMNHSVAYRLGSLRHADFYQYLRQLCDANGVSLSRYPAMQSYLQYVLLSDAINMERLMTELHSAEEAVYASLATTPDEQNLIRHSKQLYLTAKLIDFELTQDEWKEYKAVIASSPRRTKQSHEVTSFEKFYREAEARDAAMANNLLRRMDETNTSYALLVTGGFHSNGIAQRLAAAGVTTITFAPKISKVDTDQGSAYLNVFTQEHTPLEKLAQGEKLFLAFPPAAGTGTDLPTIASVLTPGNPQQTLRQLAPDSDVTLQRSDADTVVAQSKTGDRVRIHVKTAAQKIVSVSYEAVRPAVFWLHEARHWVAGALLGNNVRKVSSTEVAAEFKSAWREAIFLLIGPVVDIALGVLSMGLVITTGLRLETAVSPLGLMAAVALMGISSFIAVVFFYTGTVLSKEDWSRANVIFTGDAGSYPKIAAGHLTDVKPAWTSEDRIAKPEDDWLWNRIAKRFVWWSAKMIALANEDKYGPKIGGHQAATTSCLHIMMAVYFFFKRGSDHVQNKPHANPTTFAMQYGLGILDKETMYWLRETVVENPDPDLPLLLAKLPSDFQEWLKETIAAAEKDLPGRAKGDGLKQAGLQSYHSMRDPGNTVPSGSVGLHGSTGICLAIVMKWLKAHGYDVPQGFFTAIVGDGESDEGNYLEALPEAVRYKLGNVIHIIDYNRQSLDGNRTTFDYTQLKNKFAGWRIVELRWGRKMEAALSGPYGNIFQRFLDSLSELDVQALTGLSAEEIRSAAMNWAEMETRRDRRKLPAPPNMKGFLDQFPDDKLMEIVRDFGGHDLVKLTQALDQARKKEKEGVPTVIIAHTIKAWGIPTLVGVDKNHMTNLSNDDEALAALGASVGAPENDPFAPFQEGPEKAVLAALSERIKAEDAEHAKKLQDVQVKNAIDPAAIPDRLSNVAAIKMFREISTNDMMNQMNTKLLAYLNTDDEKLDEEGKKWKQVAQRLVGVFPDVGLSTLTGFMQSIFGEPERSSLPFSAKVKQTLPRASLQGRHFDTSIREMLSVNIAFSLGRAYEIFGVRLLPVTVIYTMFFFRRAKDIVFYGAYWLARFFGIGVPSGSTTGPEGAQHQYSGLLDAAEIPNLIGWSPSFPDELEFIIPDAIKRLFAEDDKARNVPYIENSTQPILRSLLWDNLRGQKKYEGLDDEEIKTRWGQEVLKGGYRLTDHSNQPDYDPTLNVVNLVTTGPMVLEAVAAAKTLWEEQQVYANIIIVTSQDLLYGKLAEGAPNGYAHLQSLIPQSERLLTPVVTVADVSPKYLAGIGDVLKLGAGVKNLGVIRHGFSTRAPPKIYRYHGISRVSIVGEAWNLLVERDEHGGVADQIVDWSRPKNPPTSGSWSRNIFYSTKIAWWLEGVVSVGVGYMLSNPWWGALVSVAVFLGGHVFTHRAVFRSSVVYWLALLYAVATASFISVGYHVGDGWMVSVLVFATAVGYAAGTGYHFYLNQPSKNNAELVAKIYAHQISSVLGAIPMDSLQKLNADGVGLAHFTPDQMNVFLATLTADLRAARKASPGSPQPTWNGVFERFWDLSMKGVATEKNVPDQDVVVFVADFSPSTVSQIKELRRQLPESRRILVIAEASVAAYRQALSELTNVEVAQEGPSILQNGVIDLALLKQVSAQHSISKAMGLLGSSATFAQPNSEAEFALLQRELFDLGFSWGKLDEFLKTMPLVEPLGIVNILHAAMVAMINA